MSNIIDSFSGSNRFLSNFYICDVEFENITYPSVEHAYQAAKSLKVEDRRKFSLIENPAEAKALGRKIYLRHDWDDTKKDVMFLCLLSKFSNQELAQKLVNTGDSILIEGNHWGDIYWGVCNGLGENNLGKLLMYLRKQLVNGGLHAQF